MCFDWIKQMLQNLQFFFVQIFVHFINGMKKKLFCYKLKYNFFMSHNVIDEGGSCYPLRHHNGVSEHTVLTYQNTKRPKRLLYNYKSDKTLISPTYLVRFVGHRYVNAVHCVNSSLLDASACLQSVQGMILSATTATASLWSGGVTRSATVKMNLTNVTVVRFIYLSLLQISLETLTLCPQKSGIHGVVHPARSNSFRPLGF